MAYLNQSKTKAVNFFQVNFVTEFCDNHCNYITIITVNLECLVKVEIPTVGKHKVEFQILDVLGNHGS